MIGLITGFFVFDVLFSYDLTILYSVFELFFVVDSFRIKMALILSCLDGFSYSWYQ